MLVVVGELDPLWLQNGYYLPGWRVTPPSVRRKFPPTHAGEFFEADFVPFKSRKIFSTETEKIFSTETEKVMCSLR